MDFSLTTLGTASARPTSGRFPSAHILTVGGRLFLLDCGEGAQMQIVRNKISIARIDNIFISHLHGDHVFGIYGLLSTLSMMGRTTPLHIYAPAGMESIVNSLRRLFGELMYEVVVHTVRCDGPVVIEEFRQIEILAFPLRHRVETYGYLFREKVPPLNVYKPAIEKFGLGLEEIARLKEGVDVVRVGDDGSEELLPCSELTYKPFIPRSFAYCSDTMPFAELSGWLRGVTMIYHEATYASDLEELAKSNFDSTSRDAARCAAEAGARKLVLGHYSSRYKTLEKILEEAREIFPETDLSKEGMNFDIPLQKGDYSSDKIF